MGQPRCAVFSLRGMDPGEVRHGGIRGLGRHEYSNGASASRLACMHTECRERVEYRAWILGLVRWR